MIVSDGKVKLTASEKEEIKGLTGLTTLPENEEEFNAALASSADRVDRGDPETSMLANLIRLSMTSAAA